DVDSAAKEAPPKDEIKINGADTRGQDMSLEDVQKAALGLSKQHLVVFVLVDKGDAEYENLIKEAVRENIRAGRDNIYVVFAKNEGGQGAMACLSKGIASLPIVKGDDDHLLGAFIKRVYTEDSWAVTKNTEAPAFVVGSN